VESSPDDEDSSSPYGRIHRARAVGNKPRRLPFAAERFGFQGGIPMSCGHVVLAEAHSNMLEGIRRMIETMAKSVIMVSDEPSLIQAMDRMKPDLVIADLSFQVSGAANVVRLIKLYHPAIKVIAVSLYDDPIVVNEAVDAGAEGFVLKRRAVVDLIPAIHEVYQGRRYVSTGNCSEKDQNRR
jgi:DNA-binding NarL/FixJ family response regulator